MRRPLVIVAIALAATPAAVAKLPLKPCVVNGVMAQCGRLVVPENYAKPQGRTIALRVMVLKAALADARPDPLFYLIGGPGLPATYDAPAMQSSFGLINMNHDIVLVDQRGTGASNALACPPPPKTLPKGMTPKQASIQYVRTCTAHLKGDARQYGTATATDDLDAVRKALGYGKIDLYGLSYGSFVAQVYMNRHPGSVRAVVLDGATLIDIPIWERWGSNGQLALDRIAKRCAADRACRKAFPTWRADLPGLLARLDHRPAKVKVEGGLVELDGTGAANTIQALSQTAEGAATIPYVVAHAVKGDYGPLASGQSPFASAPQTAIMPWSTRCTEPWSRWRPSVARAEAKGTYLAKAAVAAALQQQLVCGGFPKRVENPRDWVRPHLDVPLLAIVGAADPQNPVRNIAGIKQGVPRARLVVVPAQGHAIASRGCLPGLMSSFLDTGSALALDISCAHAIPPTPFRVS
jgi:pimeloyl-ACP methyl ester carboxylesterase